MARNYSLSDVASDSEALDVDNDIVGRTPSFLRPGPSGESVVTRKYPRIAVASGSVALNIDNDRVGETPSHHG